MKRKMNHKLLSAAVLFALMTMGSTAGANQSVTATVDKDTNTSTASNPYSSISVSGTTAGGIILGTTDTSDMTVYVAGDDVLHITANNPSSGSGGGFPVNSVAFGMSNNAATTLTEKGTLSGTISAMGGIGGAGTGGSGATVWVNAQASAYGMGNYGGGTLTSGDIKNLTVMAIGGTGTGGTGDHVQVDANATVYGLENENKGTITTGNIENLSIIANGGKAISGTAANVDSIDVYANAGAEAYGVNNKNGKVTIGDLIGIAVEATGGVATSQQTDAVLNASASARGVYTSGGTVDVTGNVDITNIKATAGTVVDENGVSQKGMAESASLFADGGSITLHPGKTVKLAGDVVAINGGTNTVTLTGTDSYLQGNILNKLSESKTSGTNTVTVTNGAVWKPVFDNRYGSFNIKNDTTTYDPDRSVTENSVASLTLSNGGIVDLTWDNRTRSDNFRNLIIDTLTGDDGIFKVNTDLANNKADQISLGTGSTSTKVGIDVTYDPYLAASGLTNGSILTGNGQVLKDNSKKITTVYGVADSYNLYDYIPTITANGDNTYSVTKLTITNADAALVPLTPSTPAHTSDPEKVTITAPSQPMREAGHARMAMQSLWVNGELNNMTKRLGDLRAMEPDAAGIWARYEHNKLTNENQMSLTYNTFQGGFDQGFTSKNGTTYRGIAVSYIKGTGDYEIGSGDVKETAVSLYKTRICKNGSYYDIILKGGKLMNTYDLTQTANPSSADYNTWGYSVSGELGKRFNWGHGIYMEPQMEMTLGKLRSTDYVTSTGMKIEMDDQNTALARVGLALGKEFNGVGSLYLKASYYHDFSGSMTMTASDDKTNPFTYREDGAKNWCVFTLGTAINIGNCAIYGECSKYTGQLTNDLQYNGGIRWKI